jgi:hypothetical protein
MRCQEEAYKESRMRCRAFASLALTAGDDGNAENMLRNQQHTQKRRCSNILLLTFATVAGCTNTFVRPVLSVLCTEEADADEDAAFENDKDGE